MKAEHWTWQSNDEYGGCESLDPVETQEVSHKVLREMYTNGKLCCVIEGKDWVEIRQKYNEHMGWGPYIPPPH
jgi:hypothetical protein